MIQWRSGVVAAVVARWAGAVEYAVELGAGASVRAIGYVELLGELPVGATVLLNTTALERGLGTGGLAVVIASPDHVPPPVADVRAVPGHLVKARYTPSQTMVLGVDEQDSVHHPLLADADTLGRLPVVVADLHSALPAVVAGLRADAPEARVAYVMTDGGALPLALSRTVAALREAGWLAASITVGQAFGGDLEAVNVHTGLLAARHVVAADVAVVAQGPGNLGTGTRWGFSGTSAGEAVNAAATLGGCPVCALRVSEADPRERHRGLSHHSHTAYGRVALVPADVPIPLLPGPFGERLRAEAATLCAASGGRLTAHDVPVAGLEEALRAAPVRLSTMGRGYDEDRASFLSGAAAGRFAARLLAGG
ncbi:MAG TPA: DUF3866 family protein [Intrasporangium sp.]|uniref:DUF3866 family protein n=1 Tax=Intrasporangium sp. TaxID=1925024 RepID=UPI002D777910|nr:DUF3866 family protein [Intrasporangium sp.]HET7397111.1 DUF3866 family protein [Intrasporangium sp.]